MSDQIKMHVDSIYHRYGKNFVLDNISYSAEKGSVTGFLGPNGAGKSTLMQIVAGVLAATSGSVTINGFDVQLEPAKAKALLGYLPDRPPVYPDCSIDGFLRYSAQLRKVPDDEMEQSIACSKSICGLENKGDKLIRNLSKGYLQRVGLAQAIIHSPEILILDEPSSGLDPNQMIEMRNLITELRDNHCVIFSTHILSEAASLCDRILIINNGKIVLDKPTDFFEDEKALENSYIKLTGIQTANSSALSHDT